MYVILSPSTLYSLLSHVHVLNTFKINSEASHWRKHKQFFSLLLKDFGPEDETGAMTK